MRYHVKYGKKFRKQFRKLLKSGSFDREKVEKIIDDLTEGKTLAPVFRDHQLTGDMQIYRECHVSGDILIVYRKFDSLQKIVFSQIGSHSELFG